MTVKPDLYQSLKFRSIGPHRGGRVVAVSGVVGQPNVYYFGSTGGGIWKTTDNAQTWRNVSDGFFKRASVGALAVSESDPNVIYVGMGETTIRGNVSRGDGVYKSTDAGKSWQHMGLAETQNIGAVVIHPSNPDLVYAAAFGHVWGENSERGLYRSNDGGKSWERILFKSNRAGVNDLTMDPTNPRILYANVWEASRGPYFMSSGGEDSGIWRSFDGGDTWEDISHNPGLPQGVLGKCGLAASAARAGRVYAIVEAEDGAVFTSDNYGDTWTRGSEDTNLRQRAWYYHHIFADPQDENTAWVLNVEMWKSIDAGKTFQKVPAPHGDNHDLWIDPLNADRMILGNDGGATVSTDGGGSWTSLYNQPTGEFYHVTVDNRVPYRVYGAQQDNTTMSIPSRSRNAAIILPEWEEIGGGESGYIAVDPKDPNVIYAGSMSGYLTRYDAGTGHLKDVSVWPFTKFGGGAKDLGTKDQPMRWQWTSPIHLSPHDSSILYSGGNMLWRSQTQGQQWAAISPDLTRADPETLEASGGPITKDNTGAETYATIFAFAESPIEAGTLWAGSDDGLVHVSRDNGQSWTNVNPPELPDWALISIIEASPHNPAKAYVAATRYKSHDDKPYLYKTTDYGATWEAIVDGIPEDDFTRVIREDPVREGLLFAGTETGIYVSFDDGGSWERLQLNLPIVPIHDFIIHGHDLVVATHGRSFWVLDDISPLRQANAELNDATAHLFKPGLSLRMPGARDFGHDPIPGKNYWFAGGMIVSYDNVEREPGVFERSYVDAGNNPVDGVVIHYYLKEEDEEATLTFLDSEGSEIRTLKAKKEDEKSKDPVIPAKAGANRFVWDTRFPGADPIKDDDSRGGFGGVSAGPKAPPGSYQVRLESNGQTLTETFEIEADPRRDEGDGGYQAQFDLLMQIRDKLTETNQAINRIRSIRAQSDAWGERSEDEGVKAAAKELHDKLYDIEGELIQYRAKSVQDTLNFPAKLNSELAALAGVVSGAEGRPTTQAFGAFQEIAGRVDEQLARLNALVESDVAAFNQKVRDSGAPPIG